MYESGEDYLEAILRLQLENGFVRSVDVANKLGVSRPSVSRAMGLLERDGYIEFSLGNMIKLTEKGTATAEDIYGRHKLLTAFLKKITGVPEDQAEENACRVEHDIDADIVAGIQRWMDENSDETSIEKTEK
ncbi:MAG: metal-dependent transcriptional regulator [Treponema sp.]|nr:metal-dependent transcriptional regulator [Treponema sp.]